MRFGLGFGSAPPVSATTRLPPTWRQPALSCTITECRDPKDNKFLEVAVAGRADVIVTGDGDLEVLDPFEGIPLIRPAKFLQLLKQ